MQLFKKVVLSLFPDETGNEGIHPASMFISFISTKDFFSIINRRIVENYKINAKLRITIKKVSETAITTFFDIMLPGKPYVCYEQNKLIKVGW